MKGGLIARAIESHRMNQWRVKCHEGPRCTTYEHTYCQLVCKVWIVRIIYMHIYIYIYNYKLYIMIYLVNLNISLTWIKAILGWFPLLTMIIVRSQWGRYNLPIYIYNIYIYNDHITSAQPTRGLMDTPMALVILSVCKGIIAQDGPDLAWESGQSFFWRRQCRHSWDISTLNTKQPTSKWQVQDVSKGFNCAPNTRTATASRIT